jgi:hypothetical protein
MTWAPSGTDSADAARQEPNATTLATRTAL